MNDEEAWRTQVWCPKHERVEQVICLQSEMPLYLVPAFEAGVILECGKRRAVVTTFRNLTAMRALDSAVARAVRP